MSEVNVTMAQIVQVILQSVVSMDGVNVDLVQVLPVLLPVLLRSVVMDS